LTDEQAARAEAAARSVLPWGGEDEGGQPTADTRTGAAVVKQAVQEYLALIVRRQEGKAAQAAVKAFEDGGSNA
tara:strand:- start:381 stop:602 length:222 start_codon:yes stop_codon:yes gene_type:complete